MTATANITRTTATSGQRTHRFATPVVREIRSRRTAPQSTTNATISDPVAARMAALIAAAGRGDGAAWEQLIEEFSPMLRSIARSYRLAPSDVDDVLQETWIALHANIDRLRNPGALPGWLSTTVRRRSLGLLQAANREQLTYDLPVEVTDDRTPEKAMLATERREVFARAVGALPKQQRRVVTALAARPDLDYQQLATLLQMPIGSLGPTRARGLASLERDDELRFWHTGAA
jgi:RNA polymerase sigma factor (sigma-70 family)